MTAVALRVVPPTPPCGRFDHPHWGCRYLRADTSGVHPGRPTMIPTSRLSFCAIAGAGGAYAGLAAHPSMSEAAQGKLVAGTLTGKGHGGVGLILGSKETLHCIFTSASGAHRRRYVATITKVGVDIGFKGESTLIWTVLSSTSDIPSGALVGTYGGGTAGGVVVRRGRAKCGAR